MATDLNITLRTRSGVIDPPAYDIFCDIFNPEFHLDTQEIKLGLQN